MGPGSRLPRVSEKSPGSGTDGNFIAVQTVDPWDSRHLHRADVYARDAQDQSVIRHTIDEQLGEESLVIHLDGELCRNNLVGEVEVLHPG